MTPEEKFVYRHSNKCPFTGTAFAPCGDWGVLYSIENQCGLSGLANEMDHLARSIDQLQVTLNALHSNAQ